MAANKHAGDCADCGRRVEAGAGALSGKPGAWQVRHAEGECPEPSSNVVQLRGREVMEMTRPCTRCESTEGYVTTKNLQDVVRCTACDAFVYNRTKSESGRETYTVRSQAEIAPSQRARILWRDGARCRTCGSADDLHIGHVLSVADAAELGVAEEIVWSDRNLFAECVECNLGHGAASLPLVLAYALWRAADLRQAAA